MSALDALFSELAGRVTGRVERDVELSRLTTYRVGGPARIFFEPADLADLEVLARALTGIDEDIAILPLGRGSNLVVSDEGFAGVVVHLGAGFDAIETAGTAVARAGAAVTMPQVTNWTARRGWAGFEFAIAIPGSVGGGVRMNAGAHAADIASCLVRATVFSLDEAAVGEVSAADLDLSYRHSGLTDHHVVLDATFRLHEEDPTTVKERVEAYRRHRAETQPPAVQNAGSVFKNPPGDHAGKLVDAAGLKGFSVGDASVSELHANFFIARDGAGAQDVYDLVQAVRARVKDVSGILLEPEIRFVGTFR